MRHHFLPIAACALFAHSASAQTQEQKNVMQHLAVLYIADKWCSDYSVKLENINRAATRLKIRPDRAPFTDYIKEQMKETEESLSEAGIKDGCTVIYGLYGPKGSAATGQMMRK